MNKFGGLSYEYSERDQLLDGMNIIGQKFKNNEVFVPEVLIAARAMTKGIEMLRPLLVADGIEEKGTVIIGTVKGDLHDIGKNLVRMMMEGKGLKVVDLGVDVSVEAFLEAAREHNAQVIACSALLTTTMGEMRNVVGAVRASEMGSKVRVMVGGAPITQAFCDQIGADRFTPDAASAAEAALEAQGTIWADITGSVLYQDNAPIRLAYAYARSAESAPYQLDVQLDMLNAQTEKPCLGLSYTAQVQEMPADVLRAVRTSVTARTKASRDIGTGT